jgi:hypothetical protein
MRRFFTVIFLKRPAEGSLFTLRMTWIKEMKKRHQQQKFRLQA